MGAVCMCVGYINQLVQAPRLFFTFQLSPKFITSDRRITDISHLLEYTQPHIYAWVAWRPYLDVNVARLA